MSLTILYCMKSRSGSQGGRAYNGPEDVDNGQKGRTVAELVEIRDVISLPAE